MPDDSLEEPAPIEPLPRRRTSEPMPAEDAFPEPRFPEPEPDRIDRSRSNGNAPFGSDAGFPEPGEPRPLPSADELPPRPDRPERTDRETPSRDIESRGAGGRSVSEVMRPQLTIQKRRPRIRRRLEFHTSIRLSLPTKVLRLHLMSSWKMNWDGRPSWWNQLQSPNWIDLPTSCVGHSVNCGPDRKRNYRPNQADW